MLRGSSREQRLSMTGGLTQVCLTQLMTLVMGPVLCGVMYEADGE